MISYGEKNPPKKGGKTMNDKHDIEFWLAYIAGSILTIAVTVVAKLILLS